MEREAGRRSEMKNAGLGTGIAGWIKVLWDQILLTGGTSASSGWVRSQVVVSLMPCWVFAVIRLNATHLAREQNMGWNLQHTYVLLP